MTDEIVRGFRSKVELNVFLSNEAVKSCRERVARAVSDNRKRESQEELDRALEHLARQREFLREFDTAWHLTATE